MNDRDTAPPCKCNANDHVHDYPSSIRPSSICPTVVPTAPRCLDGRCFWPSPQRRSAAPHTHTHTPRAPVLPMARGSIAQHPSEQEGRQRDRDGHTASLCKLPHVRDRPALPFSTSGKRAGTSPVNAGVHETIVERQVHFPVERLKMDLPFVNVSWVQTSAQRSASPLDAAMAELQKRA